MRKKIVGASWKMHINSIANGVSLAESLHQEVGNISDIDVFILPPFPLIKEVATIFKHGNIGWGGQNMCFAAQGAYTGEVPGLMLKELGCQYVELGHAERKAFFNETDQRVNQKLRLCQGLGLIPVLCIGEQKEDLRTGNELNELKRQILTMLDSLDPTFIQNVILAYEPVWAIGQAQTATLDYIEHIHAYLRSLIENHLGNQIANEIRIIYGGSVNPEISDELFQLPNVDGVFIGRFGLDPKNFKRIADSAIKSNH